MQRKSIVVDGSNIAYVETQSPTISSLMKVKSFLEDKGFQPTIIADASLYHEIDNPKKFNDLVDEGIVKQAPAGTDADKFVLETAEHLNCDIVTNDQYEKYREEYPWIEERRVPVMIVKEKVLSNKID